MMLKATDTKHAPWYILPSDDKKRARLNCIHHILSLIPYKKVKREKSQMYGQRYMPHLPAAGEVVIWDRSWYNRAGVERVMGFTSEDRIKRFLQLTPLGPFS